jgi:hypothetical protein
VPITLNQFQNVIKLPNSDVKFNDKGIVLGWGSISHPEVTFPVKLQKTSVRVEKISSCARVYLFKIHDEQLCAFSKQGIGPCIVSILVLLKRSFT